MRKNNTQTPITAYQHWQLVVIQGQHHGRVYPLATVTQIGREAKNEIVLADVNASRRHALIRQTTQGFVLQDLNSSNGTSVNQKRISQPVLLQVDDVITVGDTQFQVTATAVAPAFVPSASTPPPTSKPKKKRRWPLTCLLMLLVSVCSLGTFAAGGYYLVQSGQISAMQILIRAGGQGDITITNIADEPLSAELIRLDTESGEPGSLGSTTIAPFDIDGFGGVASSRYRIEFSTPGDQPPAVNCTFRLSREESYQFTAVPQGIIVTLEGREVTEAAELDVRTSSLCQP